MVTVGTVVVVKFDIIHSQHNKFSRGEISSHGIIQVLIDVLIDSSAESFRCTDMNLLNTGESLPIGFTAVSDLMTDLMNRKSLRNFISHF